MSLGPKQRKIAKRINSRVIELLNAGSDDEVLMSPALDIWGEFDLLRSMADDDEIGALCEELEGFCYYVERYEKQVTNRY
jgi:hypothetical protein